MPIYDYHCQACGKDFEKKTSMENSQYISCPDCGAKVDIVIQPTIHIWKNGKPS